MRTSAQITNSKDTVGAEDASSCKKEPAGDDAEADDEEGEEEEIEPNSANLASDVEAENARDVD